MKRRLMVAKAMVHSPPVLVLDEPTAGVDIELRQQLWAYVRQLNDRGVTVVLTTHYLEEPEELCGTGSRSSTMVAWSPTSRRVSWSARRRKGVAVTVDRDVAAAVPDHASFGRSS